MKCMNCEKELIRRQKKFCSSICQMDKQYKDYIERWKDGKEDGTKGNKVIELSGHVKRYLLEKYANRCQKCGWGRINTYTDKVPLEIHHIDGKYSNNNENNLMVLCPNCHSLTPNFKSRGSGRPYRNR